MIKCLSYCCCCNTSKQDRNIIPEVKNSFRKKYPRFYKDNIGIPTINDYHIVRSNWKDIIEDTLPLYLSLKAEKPEMISCINWFYNTFYEIWETNYPLLKKEIYKNNMIVQCKALVAMVTAIIQTNKNDYSQIALMHKSRGIEIDYFYIMGEVLFETIRQSIGAPNSENEIIYSWVRVYNYVMSFIISEYLGQQKHVSSFYISEYQSQLSQTNHSV